MRYVKKSRETSQQVKPDEDCKMEVGSEADSRKKLHQRKTEIAKQVREIEEKLQCRKMRSTWVRRNEQFRIEVERAQAENGRHREEDSSRNAKAK